MGEGSAHWVCYLSWEIVGMGEVVLLGLRIRMHGGTRVSYVFVALFGDGVAGGTLVLAAMRSRDAAFASERAAQKEAAQALANAKAEAEQTKAELTAAARKIQGAKRGKDARAVRLQSQIL